MEDPVEFLSGEVTSKDPLASLFEFWLLFAIIFEVILLSSATRGLSRSPDFQLTADFLNLFNMDKVVFVSGTPSPFNPLDVYSADVSWATGAILPPTPPWARPSRCSSACALSSRSRRRHPSNAAALTSVMWGPAPPRFLWWPESTDRTVGRMPQFIFLSMPPGCPRSPFGTWPSWSP